MGDLISRKALRDLWLYNGLNEHIYCTNDVLDSIDEQPAVDAEPVRRAQWKAANRRDTLCDTYVCSECGNMVMQAEGYTYSCTCNYCPHCGARMDGEVREQWMKQK